MRRTRNILSEIEYRISMKLASKNTYVVVTVLLLVILLGFVFLTYNRKAKIANIEKFYGDIIQQEVPTAKSVAELSNPRPDAAATGLGSYGASDPQGNEVFNEVSGATAPAVPSPSCFPRDRLTADDLLPKDAANSRWAQMNPAGQGDVRDQNFLTAGYHVGVNTQGSSMRNANLQLRSEPPNPQVPVSPWNISTISPDVLRKPLEVGGDF